MDTLLLILIINFGDLGTTASGAQGLLPILKSVTSHGGAQETMCGVGDGTQIGNVKASTLPSG